MVDAENHVTTKFFATQVIKSPQDSFTINEVLERTKLQNIVNDSVNDILFNDSEFDSFIELLNKSKWTYAHEDLADFITEVNNLKN